MIEIIRYLICGIVSMLVNFATYFGWTHLFGVNTTFLLQSANVISFFFSVLTAFVISRSWVFFKTGKSLWRELGEFFTCRVLTFLIDMALMEYLVFILCLDHRISKLIVQVVVTILNYIFSKLYIFRRTN